MAAGFIGQVATAAVRFTDKDGAEAAVDPTHVPEFVAADATILAFSNIALDADNKGASCRVTITAAGVSDFVCRPDVDLNPAVDAFITIQFESVTGNPRPNQATGGTPTLTPFADPAP